MSNHFTLGMTKAAELTKAGKLAEATALIQSLLTNKPPVADVEPDSTVIEGAFTRLDETVPAQASTAKAAPRRATVKLNANANHSASAPRTPNAPRASLRETLRKIAAGGMPSKAGFATTAAPLTEGAEFTRQTHRAGRDQRDYKLYIPANRSSQAMPLIVMLHGCTQSPDDFAVGTDMNTLAEQHGFMVAYPAQPSAANANKCWNWFKAEDQGRDRGEPALIAGLTRDILHDHPVDASRVYVAGLSAGGAAAAIMGAAYPDLFSAVGVHSGLAVGAASDIPQAFSAMRSGSSGKKLAQAQPTIVIHGLADNTVHSSNGAAVIAQTLGAHGRLKSSKKSGTSAGGKSYRQTSYSDAKGRTFCEHWEIDGAGHAWAGGRPEGSYTDPSGPLASQEMVRFFLQHAQD